jgi:pyruvate dehydrogenase E2 component (dihydrolipoamide acetyltransferase)
VEAALKDGAPAKSDAKADDKGTAARKPAAAPAEAPEYGPHDDIPYREERLSNMRKTIARRLTESKTTVPHFYLTIDCELDKLLAQRKELNSRMEDSGVKLSVNDFIIRACALALKKVPAANVQYAGDKMYWYERADISVAVAIEGGLVTPVVRGADQKGLAEISADVKDLATRARDGKLKPEDYAGGTFSISNLGMYGIKEFGAVINPPQGAILAVGAGEQRPVIKDGAVSVATVMSCTMSCDHRAIDGAVGAEFLAAFKSYIEDPLMMLL